MTTKTKTTATQTTQKPSKSSERSSSLDLENIKKAKERVEEVAHRTPMDRSSTFAEMSGVRSVGLKLEVMQKTGAFKIRGAYNKIAKLSKKQKNRGVIAASSGNHAQGVALASKNLGVDATIVMPEGTPDSKVEAVKGYDAEVVLEGEIYNDAYEKARELQQKKDLTFVHPYNDFDVMAGQGTLGLEMIEQFPEMDAVLVAVGGGGLVSGIAKAVKSFDGEIEVIGVQTEGCGTAKETLEQGSVYHRESTDTIAGGIETKHVGEKTSRMIQQTVDEVVYVSDEQVKTAMGLLAERQKVITEPAGAVAAAALLYNNQLEDIELKGKNVAVPLCGGNVDLEEFGEHCLKSKDRREINGR